MRRVSTSWLAGSLLILAAQNASAIIVAGTSPDSPQWLASNSVATYGFNLSGVAFVSTASNSCSGTFFEPSLTYVLTAAHCVAGFTSGYVQSGNGGPEIPIASVTANPGYNSSNLLVDDIAVVKLATPATGVNYYPIYTGLSPAGDEFLLAGFGDAGTGTTGDQANMNAADSYTAKTDRDGLNYYAGLVANSTDLAYDFYNPSTYSYPYANLNSNTNPLYANNPNVGSSDLASIAPGDSGGPSFVVVNGQLEIAGVHSATGCPTASPCTAYEYGDVAVDTDVSQFTSFIDGAAGITAVPEPATFALIGAGLLASGIRLRRRNKAA